MLQVQRQTLEDYVVCSTIRPPRWVIAWIASLLVATLVVRLAAPTGWLGSDDAAYFSAAEHLLTAKNFDRVHHHNARMAMIVPVAISMWFFGASTSTVAAPTVIASVLCVALVVIAGRLLWGWMEGLIAASIVAFHPYFRVMSTTAYPDVHVCFWALLAIVLALLSVRVESQGRRQALGLGCGFTLALACSAKVFGVLTLLPIAWIAWQSKVWGRRQRLNWLLMVGTGMTVLFVIESLFYLRTSGDFFFKFHALNNVQADDRLFPASGYFQSKTYLGLAWSRLTMLFHPQVSGFGRLAAFFFPAAMLTFILNKRGRTMAGWAVVTYVAIALVPVTYHHHWHPYPAFDGRHILVTCIPFALCFAWASCHITLRLISPVWIKRGWPIFLLALAWFSFADANGLRGFRDRETQRCGLALRQIIEMEDWDDDREIFMPASIYIRYRLFFPEKLRSRLRVAVDKNAPDWWRNASVDIEARSKSMPKPSEAYLIVTPRQLEGRSEFWDYGAVLPLGDLVAWQQAPTRTRISRFGDKTIGLAGSREEEGKELLFLLGVDAVDKHALNIRRRVANSGY